MEEPADDSIWNSEVSYETRCRRYSVGPGRTILGGAARGRGDGRRQRRLSLHAVPARTGRAHPRHRAAARRDRHGQRPGGANHSPHEPAPGDPLRQRGLHGAAGDAHRERAVRPRTGRLHGCPRDADRPVRARRRRHDLSRRDRRAARRSAGEAAARPAAGPVRAPRLAAHDQGGRARHRGHQSRRCPRRCARDVSAAISTTGSACFRSRCRRCASVTATSPCSSNVW